MDHLPIELWEIVKTYIKPKRYHFTEKKNIESSHIGGLQLGCHCRDGIVCGLCKYACCEEAKSMYCECSEHIVCKIHGSKCSY